MNYFESLYSSKIKRIVIPIPGFRRYNKTITEEGDSEFIGRERIMSRILSWLTESNNFTGACLVTGYRGMGKSSFVGEALSKIVNHSTINKRIFALLKVVWLLITCHFLMYIPLNKRLAEMGTMHWLILFGLLLIVGCILYQIYRKCIFKQEFLYFPVKINIGRDVYNEKDILYLITKNVYKQYIEYYKSTALHPLPSLASSFTKWSILVALTYHPSCILSLVKHIIPSDSHLYNFFIDFYCYFPYPFYLTYFLIGYSILSACEKAVIFLLARYYSLPFMPLSIVRNDLIRLNERIDASIKQQISGKIKEWGFLREKQYQLASVREIEHELISIFEKINQIGGTPLLFPKIRFIFILDELDKADIKELKTDDKNDEEQEQLIPPSASNDSLGSTYSPRKRKNNLIRTLAGMKYFLSTVKAKFIFVAGQELYDAYLADLSDRQFSLSSIFNEVISVESFLKSHSCDTSILTMTERLLCKQLMTVEQRSKDGHIYPAYETLQHYYALLSTSKNNSKKHPHWKLELEQRILFLYHFLYYLIHTSNGSPKKMILNLETYIRPQSYIDDKYIDEDDKTDFYLNFGDTHNFKINFVHYLAFPTIQGLVNQSQLYTDKLLVSSSFLVNHIYKYHNTGFSWRNLEYIPELLDINKMPGLRDFIGTMINFMRQVHLESIFCGLYLFKFPMHLAEEISIASNRSDELSALFNFSRDDSLAIKEHYLSLIRYYSDKTNTGCEGEATLLPSMHHILGDIYLAEEEYAMAIAEYQTALQLLKKQLEPDPTNVNIDPHLSSYMLFYVRNMLKLGVAYEKRKTYNSAYVTYTELIDKLIDFRYLNEDDLGLTYTQLPYWDYNKDWDNEHTILYLPQDIRNKIIKAHQSPLFNKLLNLKPYTEAIKETEKLQTTEKKYTQWEPGLDTEELSNIQGVQFKTCDLHNELNHISLTPRLKAIISNISVFEDIRFIYIAPLARLFVLEKMQSGGITRLNIDQAVSEFNYLHLLTDSKYKSFLFADFYRKLAEILYYKYQLPQENVIVADKDVIKDKIKEIQEKCSINIADKESEYSVSLFDTLYFYGYDIKKILHDIYHKSYKKKQLNHKEKNVIIYFIQKLGCIPLDKNEYTENSIEKMFDNLRKVISVCINSKIIIPKPQGLFKEVYNCALRQRISIKNGRNLPCYACKYYHISLQTLLQNLIPENNNPSIGRISYVTLIQWIINKGEPQIRNLTELHASLIATTLEGIGNTFLSCIPVTNNNQLILNNNDFIGFFLRLVEAYYDEKEEKDISKDKDKKQAIIDELNKRIDKSNKNYVPISQTEKSILYYWFATLFFSAAGNMLASFRCNRRILEVFSTYIYHAKEKNENSKEKDKKLEKHSDFIRDMEKHIIQRALRRIYAHYEHINFSEAQQLKLFFNKRQDETIPLRYLSHFPEIDEFLTVFYTLKLVFYRKRAHKLKDIDPSAYTKYWNLLKEYHNNIQTGHYKLITTSMQNIQNLQFKVLINECILRECGFKEIFDDDIMNSINNNHFVKVNEALTSYWAKTEIDIHVLLDNIGVVCSPNQSDDKLQRDLIEFLITDSLFCLSKMITQILPQTNSTLYTNSFIAQLYYKMYLWNLIKTGLYYIYRGVESEVVDSQDFFKRIIEQYNENNELTEDVSKKFSTFYQTNISCVQGLSDLPSKPAQKFMEKLKKDVGEDAFKLLDNTYLAESTISLYNKAYEMSHGGNTYKQMISYMNLLDDDLNNDTSQFYLAIERFKQNKNLIEEEKETAEKKSVEKEKNLIERRIKKLKIIVRNSSIYKADNYIQDNKKSNL